MRRLAARAVFWLLLAHPAFAQGAAPQAAAPAVLLPEVNVVAGTPVPQLGVGRNQVAAQTHVLTAQDIARDGNADALRALNEGVPGVTLGNAAGNPFQPDLFYHGFQASPLQGTAQGLAVYLNGVRFNQAFGDTVEWDLLPNLAIDRMTLEGSNPVYGLNALGGAVSVQLKNGFTYHGGEMDLLGGSFGKAQGEFQYGRQSGKTATYVAGSALHEGGWRDLQSSDLYNIFGDVGWRSDRAEVHMSVLAADTVLNGPGGSPVQLLAADPRAQFTAPNRVANAYTLATLNGTLAVDDTTTVQGGVYYDYFRQRVTNGNATDIAPCDGQPGLLCVAPGVFATDADGTPIPAFRNAGPYSQLDQQTTNTNGYGASVQMTDRGRVFSRPNDLVVGAGFDGADTTFTASTAVGGLTSQDRVFIGPGTVVDQADGSIAPVRVGVTSAYYGVFFTDTVHLTPRLSANVSGRFNLAEIDLKDQNGTSLTGTHSYSRFNPAAGLVYRILPGLTAYAGYSEANRTPTPAELSCASAASPCSLANFFVGDPDLNQVVAHTIEAGLRGRLRPFAGAHLRWSVGYFHSTLSDDILFVNSPVQGRAYFRNVGTTLRQGFDLGARLTTRRWRAYVGYSYTDATFQSGFTELSPDNPGADAAGAIQVRPGDHMPGVPTHLLKLGVSYRVTDKWTVGATGVGASGQYLFGDEANLQARVPGYFILNLNTSYRVTENIQVFGQVENVLDSKYYTYGTFAPTSSVFIAQAPGATNPRSYSPGAPIGGYAGLRITF